MNSKEKIELDFMIWAQSIINPTTHLTVLEILEKRKQNFIKKIDEIIESIDFENKNSDWNEDIKNNTEDKKYWEGYRYGILSILTDYLIPLKEEIEMNKP